MPADVVPQRDRESEVVRRDNSATSKHTWADPTGGGRKQPVDTERGYPKDRGKRET